MAVEVAMGTPLAEALQNVVQPKLVDVGWSTAGQDDNTLSEYIILMLVNGKTQDQIAFELSNDLLNLDPDDSGGQDFAKWLFEQIDALNLQINGGAQAAPVPASETTANTAQEIAPSTDDTSMEDDGTSGQGSIPTGPKAMRRTDQRGRERRIMGQVSKAMDRNGDSALHRVRAGNSGVGRVNSHSREPPKGPRNNLHRNLHNAVGVGRGNFGPSHMQQMSQMPQMPQMPGNGPAHPFMAMTPQQQMQIFAMYEEQAKMMQQMFNSQGFPTGGFNSNMPPQNSQQQGKSLFERVQKGHAPRANGFSGPRPHPNQSESSQNTQDTEMKEDAPAVSAMDTELTPVKEPSETMCKFNLTCSKADCPFAHQSPAAPAGTLVDMADSCSFGAACTNRKCVGRHPSPAKRNQHIADQDCRFWPNCTNPSCGFRHPNMPPCRNGADCTTPGCKFAHSKTTCKFNPCLNPSCIYKHAEGQKRGAFEDKVWTAGEEDKKEHVSERKFTVDDGVEELIIPGKSSDNVEPSTEIAS